MRVSPADTSPPLRSHLAAAYPRGFTYEELAAEHGGTEASARSAVLRAGGHVPCRRCPTRPLGRARIRGAQALRQRGLGQSLSQALRRSNPDHLRVASERSRAAPPWRTYTPTLPDRRAMPGCRAVVSRWRQPRSPCETVPVLHPDHRQCDHASGGQRRPPGASKTWTDDVIAWAVAEYRGGRSQQSIAAELGVNQTSVSNRLRAAGAIPPRARGRGAAHGSWKGGRTLGPGGYVLVKTNTDDLNYCVPLSNGYVAEHRLVMGRALGRPLAHSGLSITSTVTGRTTA